VLPAAHPLASRDVLELDGAASWPTVITDGSTASGCGGAGSTAPGLLVLLYAQFPATLSRLTLDHVVSGGGDRPSTRSHAFAVPYLR